MASMVSLSSFAGAAVLGRSAARSALAPRRRALVVRAQTEPDMEPTKETSTAETSTPSPAPAPAAAPKPKSRVSTDIWDVLAFSGPAPERINGRLAMVGFVSALSVEAASGRALLSQAGSGTGLAWFATTAAVLSVASLVPMLQGESVLSRPGAVMSADAELWNGRFAMLGLVALAVTEMITGAPFINV